MNTFECIQTRRSTRKYLDKPVEFNKIQQIIEAGRYAPSGGNSQSCHFIVVENKEVLSKLARLAKDAFSLMEITESTYKSLASSIRQSKQGDYVFHYNAPVLIIVANQENYTNNIADSVCATQNMLLMANELNLGSCYINQLKWLNNHKIMNEYLYTLGLKPTEKVYASLIVGYPDTENLLPNRNQLKRIGNEITYIK